MGWMVVLLLLGSAGANDDAVEKHPWYEDATITVEGDTQEGCLFLYQGGHTCCYTTFREELCNPYTQDPYCRQEGEYTVTEEGGGWGHGKCILDLPNFGSNSYDAGTYKVEFPVDSVSKTVVVQGYKIWTAVEKAACGIGVILLTALLFALLLYFLIECLKKRRSIWDENIMKAIKEEDTDNFLRTLGDRTLHYVRDEHGNSVFHLAAKSTWPENMTQLVHKKMQEQVEVKGRRWNQRQSSMAEVAWMVVKQSVPKCNVTSCQSAEEPDVERIQLDESSTRFDIFRVDCIERNSKNNDGQTPFHIACQENEDKVVEVLMEQKVTPDILNQENLSPLHIAVIKENLAIVKLLLPKPPPENNAQSENQGQEEGPAEADGTEITDNENPNRKLLLQKSSVASNNIVGHCPKCPHCIGERDDGKTALQIAARRGLRDIFSYILDDLDDTSWKEDKFVLINLVATGHTASHVEMHHKLMLKGAFHVDMHELCEQGKEEEVGQILEQRTKWNLDINTLNKDNHTPLHKAVINGHLNIVDKLLSLKDMATALLTECVEGGETAIEVAIGIKPVNQPLMVNYILDKQKIALEEAVFKRGLNREMIKQLLPKGICTTNNIQTQIEKHVTNELLTHKMGTKGSGGEGETVIQAAVRCGSLEVVKYIIEELGYDISKHESLAFVAMYGGNKRIEKRTYQTFQDPPKPTKRTASILKMIETQSNLSDDPNYEWLNKAYEFFNETVETCKWHFSVTPIVDDLKKYFPSDRSAREMSKHYDEDGGEKVFEFVQKTMKKLGIDSDSIQIRTVGYKQTTWKPITMEEFLPVIQKEPMVNGLNDWLEAMKTTENMRATLDEKITHTEEGRFSKPKIITVLEEHLEASTKIAKAIITILEREFPKI